MPAKGKPARAAETAKGAEAVDHAPYYACSPYAARKNGYAKAAFLEKKFFRIL